MASKTANPEKVKKAPKKVDDTFNPIKFMDFMASWLDAKNQASTSYESVPLGILFKASLLVITVTVLLIAVIGMSVGAVIAAIKAGTIMLILYVFILFITYYVIKDNKVYIHAWQDLENRYKIILAPKESTNLYDDVYIAYEAYLKRENASN